MGIRWPTTIFGIVSFTVGVIAGVTVMLHPWIRSPEPDTNIIFPDIYGDAGPPPTFGSDSYEVVQGRWSEETPYEDGGVFRKNNYAIISCEKDKDECLYSLIEQIGPNQLGDLNPPASFPIKEWNNYVISASDADEHTTGCVRTTINIDRKKRSVELVMEPINQSTLECAHASNKLHKYTLKSPLSWYLLHPESKLPL